MNLTAKQLHRKRVHYRVLMSRLIILNQRWAALLMRQENSPSKIKELAKIKWQTVVTCDKMQQLWAEIEGSMP